MKTATKVWLGIFVVVLAFISWWMYFTFGLPRYHADAKGDLVSGTTKLVLVSKMLPNDHTNITIPHLIPFWRSIGIVDGSMAGHLWGFTDHDNLYVLYQPNTEMPWQTVYKYAAN